MSDTPYPKTVALILSLGIDPDAVLIRGMDVNGYEEVQRENGARLYRPFIDPETGEDTGDTEIVTIHREWPSHEIALKVMEQFIQEEGHLR